MWVLERKTIELSSRIHNSEVNLVKHLLAEQENNLNQKLLSKRLKSQRQNYLLRTNQDIQESGQRNIMTSLQQVRNYEKIIPNVKMYETRKSLQNLFFYSN